jgi:hypothetical protein
MKNIIKALFGKKENPNTVSGKIHLGRKPRSLHFEPLEERQLLAVSVAEFNQIRTLYPDLNLSANMGDYNVIEITATQLATDVALRNVSPSAALNLYSSFLSLPPPLFRRVLY